MVGWAKVGLVGEEGCFWDGNLPEQADFSSLLKKPCFGLQSSKITG
jgi:hypothetical protein